MKFIFKDCSQVNRFITRKPSKHDKMFWMESSFQLQKFPFLPTSQLTHDKKVAGDVTNTDVLHILWFGVMFVLLLKSKLHLFLNIFCYFINILTCAVTFYEVAWSVYFISPLLFVSKAPKKAKKRSAEGANSNVFSMFEQAQIQEFKEVRAAELIFMLLV